MLREARGSGKPPCSPESLPADSPGGSLRLPSDVTRTLQETRPGPWAHVQRGADRAKQGSDLSASLPVPGNAPAPLLPDARRRARRTVAAVHASAGSCTLPPPWAAIQASWVDRLVASRHSHATP